MTRAHNHVSSAHILFLIITFRCYNPQIHVSETTASLLFVENEYKAREDMVTEFSDSDQEKISEDAWNTLKQRQNKPL